MNQKGKTTTLQVAPRVSARPFMDAASDKAHATEKPPRKPPQVSSGTTPPVSWRTARHKVMGAPTP